MVCIYGARSTEQTEGGWWCLVQLEFKQEIHWLADGESFLVDVHWTGGTAQSSAPQAFMGNQSPSLNSMLLKVHV